MANKGTGSQQIPALVGLGVVLLGVTLFMLFRGSDGASRDSGLATLALAQTTATDAMRVLEIHSDEAYADLKASAQRLTEAGTGGLTAEQANAVRSLQGHATTLQNGRDAHATLVAADESLGQIVPIVIDRANVLEQAAIVQNRSIVAAQLERMRLLANGLKRDAAGLANGSGVPAITSQNMLDAEMAIAQIVRGFADGDPVLGLRAVSDGKAIEALSALRDATARLGDAVRDVLAVADQLGAETALRQQIMTLSAAVSAATLASSGDVAGGGLQRYVFAGLVGASLVLFLLIGWMNLRARDFSRATALQAEQQERNQKAIMRLLDELGSLADGDLTVKATVTEDITGAIADSINYAIEALRDLVTTLHDSSIMVDGAAKQTDKTAQQLAEASESQSKQIEAASDAIMRMAASIEEISGNAERSSDVARHSVDVAHKGGDAVRRTIEGMNTIRETIQDTAKRIKRLGESSQEIGNIVELINDIADQTNILALNASIQASMAGEGGRGFAVVADEVQRLAERSANATKQIEGLVRTIQTDTNEAVVSMERSTTDVVGGALLAENAGAALEEIEQVSNQIASLVQNISSSAREQSGAAAIVTRNMDRLQEINVETEASTSATTESISKLAELSAQLRESVAGFRLPSDNMDQGDGDEIVDEIEDEILGNLASESTGQNTSDDPADVSYANQKTA